MKAEVNGLFNAISEKNSRFALMILSYLEDNDERAIFTTTHSTTDDNFLSFAIQAQAQDVIEKLLEFYTRYSETKRDELYDLLFNTKNKLGNNTFMTAVSEGHIQIVKWLCNFMKHNKDRLNLINIMTMNNEAGNSVFHLAAECMRQDLTQEYSSILTELLLIINFSYQNKQSSESIKGKEKVCDGEIDSQIPEIRTIIFNRNYEGATPLISAAKNNQLDLCQLLLKYIVATDSNNNPTSEFDDDCHAIINQVDLNGNTALHYACLNECVDLASKLLFHGADERITNNQGLVAFDQLSEKHGEFLVLLSHQGAFIGRCLNSSHAASLNSAATDQAILLLGALFKPNPISIAEIPAGIFDLNDAKEFYFKNKRTSKSQDIVQHCRTILSHRIDLTPSQQKLIFTFYTTIQPSLQTLVTSKLLYDVRFPVRKTYEAVAICDLFVALDSYEDSNFMEFIRRLDLETCEIVYFLINDKFFCFNRIQDQCVFIPCTHEMITILKSLWNFNHLSSFNKDKGKEKEIEHHSNFGKNKSTVTVNNEDISQINLRFRFNSNNKTESDIKFKFLKIPLRGKQIAFLKQHIHPQLNLEYTAHLPDTIFEYNLVNPNLFFKKFDQNFRRSSSESVITEHNEHIIKTQIRDEISSVQKDITNLISKIKNPSYPAYFYRLCSWDMQESIIWICISLLFGFYGGLFCLSGYGFSKRDFDYDFNSYNSKLDHTEAETTKYKHEQDMASLAVVPLVFGSLFSVITFGFIFITMLIPKLYDVNYHEEREINDIFSRSNSLRARLLHLTKDNDNSGLQQLLMELMNLEEADNRLPKLIARCHGSWDQLKVNNITQICNNLLELSKRFDVIKSKLNITSITTETLDEDNRYYPSSSGVEASGYLPLVNADGEDYDLEANANTIEMENLNDHEDPRGISTPLVTSENDYSLEANVNVVKM